MKRRPTNVQSLKRAKLELKNDIELSEARIELEYKRIKDHYTISSEDPIRGTAVWLSTILSVAKPFLGGYLDQKMTQKEGSLSNSLIRILLSFLSK